MPDVFAAICNSSCSASGKSRSKVTRTSCPQEKLLRSESGFPLSKHRQQLAQHHSRFCALRFVSGHSLRRDGVPNSPIDALYPWVLPSGFDVVGVHKTED